MKYFLSLSIVLLLIFSWAGLRAPGGATSALRSRFVAGVRLPDQAVDGADQESMSSATAPSAGE